MTADFPLFFGRADHHAFLFDERQWDQLTAQLDAPAADNPRLRTLLARKPAWEP